MNPAERWARTYIPVPALLGLQFTETGLMVWTTRSVEQLDAFGVRRGEPQEDVAPGGEATGAMRGEGPALGLAHLVEEVEGIRRPEFAPRPGKACRWCEYRSSCADAAPLAS